MRLETQYKELCRIKEEINAQLSRLDREGIKDLILQQVKDPIRKKLSAKDNQLLMLGFFCQIWIEEQRKLEAYGLQSTILEGITSLEAVEEKYMAIKFALLRLETPMPDCYYEEGVEDLLHRRITGVALHRFIREETWKREENTLKLSQMLKERGEYMTAVLLLQEAVDSYPKGQNLLWELADCWIQGREWQQAYQCLNKISNPDQEVQAILEVLKEQIGPTLHNASRQDYLLRPQSVGQMSQNEEPFTDPLQEPV